MSVPPNVFLLMGKRFSRCDIELFFDKVKPCNFLCHRVFDLQAGIHLKKIKMILLVY
ncbi:hypothetical protein SSPIM334S_07814 [Streptomyces spiroverticillatus]